jgi:hypothetical protein
MEGRGILDPTYIFVMNDASKTDFLSENYITGTSCLGQFFCFLSRPPESHDVWCTGGRLCFKHAVMISSSPPASSSIWKPYPLPYGILAASHKKPGAETLPLSSEADLNGLFSQSQVNISISHCGFEEARTRAFDSKLRAYYRQQMHGKTRFFRCRMTSLLAASIFAVYHYTHIMTPA